MFRVFVLVSLFVPLLMTGCGGSNCSPLAEVCDGLDNDCDDVVDDGLQRICQTACGMGVEVCSAGQWLDCTAPSPGLEVCNGLDDDCDGCFDEMPSERCDPLEQPCSTACGNGTEYCFMGNWLDCSAPEPGTEVCDTVDNDCDGQTDEGLDSDLDSDGHFTVDSCSPPSDDCNDTDPTVHAGHSEDCDGKDNDCDLQIDEGCSCTQPSSQGCGSALGECSVGTQDCQADGSWGPCLDGAGQAVLLPGEMAELCDGLDNNCDGLTDEGNPEGGSVCGTTEGVCEVGAQVCLSGSLDCEGGVPPIDEECDGLDNDCDGETDEDLPPDNWEANDECSLAREVADVDEGGEPVLTEKTLYPAGDEDWFQVTANEAFHVCTPGEDQCYDFVSNLTLPIGADPAKWQLCLHAADCAAYPDPGLTFCTSYPASWDATGRYFSLIVQWEGICGFDDSFEFQLVVHSSDAQNPVAECRPYRLEMGMNWLGNQSCP